MNAVALIAAVIDAFWQSALLVLTAATVLRCLRRASAAVHATVWFAVIIVGTLLPAIDVLRPTAPVLAAAARTPELTVRLVADSPVSANTSARVTPVPLAPQRSAMSDALALRDRAVTAATGWLQRNAVALLIVWASVSAFMLARIGVSIATIARMKRRAKPGAPAAAVALATGIRRPARMLISDDVQAPCVLGYRRPAVVFPAALIKDLSDDDFLAVARHELAHVGRYDDWTQLAERIAIAFVPMLIPLQFASRRLALQREIACDDAVVQSHDDALRYAQTLAAIAKRSATQRRLFASPGLVQRSLMLARIQRIVTRRVAGDRRTTALSIATALTCVAVVTAGALCARPVRAALVSPIAGGTRDADISPLHLSLGRALQRHASPKPARYRIIGVVRARPINLGSPVRVPAPVHMLDVNAAAVKPALAIKPVPHAAPAVPAPPASAVAVAIDTRGISVRANLRDELAAAGVEADARDAQAEARADAAVARAELEQRVDPETLRAMRRQFGALSAGEVGAMEAQGIDADYLRELATSGIGKLSPHDAIALRIQGVDGEYVRALRDAGLTSLPVEALIDLRIQGVDGEYVRELRDAGLSHLSTHDLIDLRIQGVDGAWLRSLHGSGVTGLSVHEIIRLRIMGQH